MNDLAAGIVTPVFKRFSAPRPTFAGRALGYRGYLRVSRNNDMIQQ